MSNCPGWVAVGVKVGVRVGVRVAVLVGVLVLVDVGVFVAVFVGVAVNVGVTVGPPVSTFQVRAAGVGSVLPAVSVAATTNVCTPLYRSLKVRGEEQSSMTSCPSSWQVSSAVSLAEKVNIAELLLTVPSGPELIVVSGAVLSTVTTRPAEEVAFKPISTARAVSVTEPSLTVVESQRVVKGAV